ncbi:MAG TPA: hypothetical protein VLF68_00905 [Candidatus Saccharimonadales bacterium]|nr:hypothetical protein [Candidatus Saccharimonadales bacterium]
MAVALIAVSAVLLQTHRQVLSLTSAKNNLTKQLAATTAALKDLQNQDQYKINQSLKDQIQKTHDDYTKTITLYQQILDLRAQKQDTKKLDELYGAAVKELADLKYASAESTLADLNKQIDSANASFLAATVETTVNAPQSNSAPSSGFSLQQVSSDVGTFPIAIISADLNSTRVIVDTASDSDCSNNCPVLSLGDYVSRNGAYAGINGSFFCPADYPSCAGKVNSFDTLLMNKNKKYFNSDNNIYSSVPLVYFSGNSMGVRGASSQWGRDTGVDAVIAMQPLLLSSGNIAYGGGGSDKFGAKGLRSLSATKEARLT